MAQTVNMKVQELPYLPPEVWVLVFGYLNTEEKHTARLCCRHFRDLIDHPSLWKDYTAGLSNFPRYTSRFWDTVQCRRVSRATVQHLRPKDWKILSKSLPSLNTIVCVRERRYYKMKYLDNLCEFPNLTSLGVRNATWVGPLLLQCQSQQLAERLTHLSVCNIQMSCEDTVAFINSVSRLVNLEYLLFHQQESEGLGRMRPVPSYVFHNLLLSLKKLKHLSWGMKGEPPVPLPDNYFYPLDPENPGEYGGPELISLELVNYTEIILSEDALRGLTSLKSLAVHYRYPWDGIQCHLDSWLIHLQQLESLSIIGGNFLASYTEDLPSQVTSLTLRTSICACQMNSIASQLKRVEHLDIDQNRFADSLCKQLPTLFPQLRTLRIRFHCEEPKRDLLFLNKLRHLERLELIKRQTYILISDENKTWPSPSLEGLIKELREISRNRFSIMTTMPERDVFRECDCIWEREETRF
ncbi:U2 small nuclear ribonucleoprotein A' [Sarotherodon galilaeus]